MGDRRPQYSFKEYKTPMDKEYHPELDFTPLDNTEMHTIYRSMIGSLNWLISIGHLDIQYAVTTLARYSHAPCEGHFKAALRIMGRVKQFPKLNYPTLP